MKYASKPVPEGAKFRNAPLLAAGIGILRVCHLLGMERREHYEISWHEAGHRGSLTPAAADAEVRAPELNCCAASSRN